MLIVKPATDGFNIWSVLRPDCSVFFVTVRRPKHTQICRKRCRRLTGTFAAVLVCHRVFDLCAIHHPLGTGSIRTLDPITAASCLLPDGVLFQPLNRDDCGWRCLFSSRRPLYGLIWASDPLDLAGVFGGPGPLPTTLIGCLYRRATGVVHACTREAHHHNRPLPPLLNSWRRRARTALMSMAKRSLNRVSSSALSGESSIGRAFFHVNR